MALFIFLPPSSLFMQNKDIRENCTGCTNSGLHKLFMQTNQTQPSIGDLSGSEESRRGKRNGRELPLSPSKNWGLPHKLSLGPGCENGEPCVNSPAPMNVQHQQPTQRKNQQQRTGQALGAYAVCMIDEDRKSHQPNTPLVRAELSSSCHGGWTCTTHQGYMGQ